MNKHRIFPTTAAERYDRALAKSLKLNPLPPGTVAPHPSGCWPAENVVLLEQFRDWLVAGGSSTEVINQHRIPLAGTLLGLELVPHPRIDLAAGVERTMVYVRSREISRMWERNCGHSLTWFGRYVRERRGQMADEPVKYAGVTQFQAGLPDWLLDALTRLLHIRQANWRPARLAVSTYQYWHKMTRIWRWLYENEIATENDLSAIRRSDLDAYIDRQLVAGYKPSSINVDLHHFQATLRFLEQNGRRVPAGLLTMPGLKRSAALPRFLQDEQVVRLRDDLRARVTAADTTVARRDSRMDLAFFYLLWQTGLRVSELEDIRLGDLLPAEKRLFIRQAKGLKDRAVYLTDVTVEAVTDYLQVRGPALSDHLFIYRHKPLSKDLVRCRIKAVGRRVKVKVTPHMLRHTFATQLINAGAKVTTIQALLGHKRLNTTMGYARVHDQTVRDDYFRAMEKIEGCQAAVWRPAAVPEQVHRLLDEVVADGLNGRQRHLLEEVRRCLSGRLEGEMSAGREVAING